MIVLSEWTGTPVTRKVEKKGEELEDSKGEMISGQNKTFKDQGKHQCLRVEKDSLLKDKEVEIIKIMNCKRRLKGRIETENSSQRKEVEHIETIAMAEMKEISEIRQMSDMRKDTEKKKQKIITKMKET